MRHLRKSRRFGRSPAHRKAMFRNMVTSLFMHERILTTVTRAKELRRVAEKLVTLGKRGDLAARRLAARTLHTQGSREGRRIVHEDAALRKLFDTLGPRFQDRPGGYTRIVRTGNRQGDNAPMAFLELLPEERKASSAKKGGKKTGKKTAKKAPRKAARKPAKKAAKKASTKTTKGQQSATSGKSTKKSNKKEQD